MVGCETLPSEPLNRARGKTSPYAEGDLVNLGNLHFGSRVQHRQHTYVYNHYYRFGQVIVDLYPLWNKQGRELIALNDTW